MTLHYRDQATGWTTGLRFPTGARTIPLAIASRPALRPTQHPIQWVTGALALGVEWLGCKMTIHLHLLPTFGMSGAIPPFSYKFSWRGS